MELQAKGGSDAQIDSWSTLTLNQLLQITKRTTTLKMGNQISSLRKMPSTKKKSTKWLTLIQWKEAPQLRHSLNLFRFSLTKRKRKRWKEMMLQWWAEAPTRLSSLTGWTEREMYITKNIRSSPATLCLSKATQATKITSLKNKLESLRKASSLSTKWELLPLHLSKQFSWADTNLEWTTIPLSSSTTKLPTKKNTRPSSYKADPKLASLELGQWGLSLSPSTSTPKTRRNM